MTRDVKLKDTYAVTIMALVEQRDRIVRLTNEAMDLQINFVCGSLGLDPADYTLETSPQGIILKYKGEET